MATPRASKIILAFVLAGVAAIWVISIQSPHMGSRYVTLGQLSRVGVAIHLYYEEHGHYPPVIVFDANRNPLYSWRVLLLPYLGETELATQFHYDEPWDSPANLKLVKLCPPQMRGGRNGSDMSKTRFRAFVDLPGPFETSLDGELVLYRGEAFRIRPKSTMEALNPILDSCIMVIEAGEEVPWTMPESLSADPSHPLPPLGGLYPDIICVVYATARASVIPRHLPEPELRALLAPPIPAIELP